MDTKSPGAGDMSDLERRLSEWRPSSTGLDADGVMYAAGRASVRPGYGRVAWPIVSGCLAVLATVLGVWLNGERTARQELVALLHKQTPLVVPAPAAVSGRDEVPLAEPPGANSYLASRRVVSGDIDAWLVADKVGPSGGPPQPSRPMLKPHSPGDLLDQ